MPNYNFANFNVTGDKEVIDKIQATGFDFEKIRPMPDSVWTEPDKPTKEFPDLNQPSWYHWRLENWGTKWNPYEANKVELERQSDIKLNVKMETAWCLPIEILKHLTKEYPIQIIGTTLEETEDVATPFTVENGVIR